MSRNREHVVKVVLNDNEAAVLDERLGALPRAVYLRRVLHGPELHRDVATRSEALSLLTHLAREGRTQAVIALARELREGGDDLRMQWILEASDDE
jgi:hypothetical protein